MTQVSPTADIIDFPTPPAADTSALQVLREMVRGFREDAEKAHRFAMMRSRALEANIEAEMERLGWLRPPPSVRALMPGDRVSYDFHRNAHDKRFGIVLQIGDRSATLIMETGGYDILPLHRLTLAPFE